MSARGSIPQVVRPADGVFARLFDEELLIVDLVRGEYYALDEIGAVLWEGLERELSVEAVANQIAIDYDVAFDVALADLKALTADLVAHRLVVEGEHQASNVG